MKILIIRLGAFGDLMRAEGALRDVYHYYPGAEIVLLTKRMFLEFGEKCPWVHRVIVDDSKGFFPTIRNMPFMKKKLTESFDLVVDLHCSWRTNFYRKYFLNYQRGTPIEQKKLPFSPTLAGRYEKILHQVSINITPYTLYPQLEWLAEDMSNYLLHKGIVAPFILFFHSCSKKRHTIKKWPYFDALAYECQKKFPEYQIAICSGPDDQSLDVNGIIELRPDQNQYLRFSQLAGLIKKSAYVIGNDTGPTYLASFLNKNGICLFGEHRVKACETGIQFTNFSYIQKSHLYDITVEEVMNKIDL